MSEQEQLHLLATDGMLVKRPILIGKTLYWLGFGKRNGKPYFIFEKATKAAVNSLCVS